jgi:hypothetical protein
MGIRPIRSINFNKLVIAPRISIILNLSDFGALEMQLCIQQRSLDANSLT